MGQPSHSERLSPTNGAKLHRFGGDIMPKARNTSIVKVAKYK
jgi:hypothetical protein